MGVASRYDEILSKLKSLSDPKAVEGMARFGINPTNTYGVSIPNLRKLAREVGPSHTLALRLWESGIHEARILAGMIEEVALVDEEQMDAMAAEFDSWDVCDQVCMNLFDRTPYAFQKAKEWARAQEEFVKRAGFALMACLARHDRSAPDSRFEEFFPLIVEGCSDDRNFVKKAVNWALRQIGKRNEDLRQKAIELTVQIQGIDSRPARWIAADALRELRRVEPAGTQRRTG